MDVRRLGFWGIVDGVLQGVGRGAAGFLMRAQGKEADDVAYAVVGGALLSAIFGAVVGYAFAELSHSVSVTGGMIIGALLGVCTGIFLGSFVETVDHSIRRVIGSLKLK